MGIRPHPLPPRLKGLTGCQAYSGEASLLTSRTRIRNALEGAAAVTLGHQGTPWWLRAQPSLRGRLVQHVDDHGSVADVGLKAGGGQREGAMGGQVAQVSQRCGALGFLQLKPIAPAELDGLVRVVVVAGAQRLGRGDRLAPLVQVSLA